MRIHRLVPLAVMTAAVLAGCNAARPVEDSATGGITGCSGCHTAPGDTGTFRAPAGGSAASVGAHTTHLANGVQCDACHVVPTSVSDAGHQDGQIQVHFGTLAGSNAAFTPAVGGGGTCSNIYCHGTTLSGGAVPTPDWNADIGQLGCTGCHATPPANHGASPGACVGCHAATVSGPTTIVAGGGAHVNGQIDAGYHPSDWATAKVRTDAGTLGLTFTDHGTAANYHSAAFPGGLADCRGCHGQNLDGQGAISTVGCGQCHTSPADAAVSCTFCHGDATRSVAANRPAPPVDTDPTAGQDARIGAHQAHLVGGVASNGIACTECHQLPTDVSHVDGQVALEFGPLASTGGQTPGFAGGTCSSVYCHGSTLLGGSGSPSWTGVAMTCSSCHGTPPATGNATNTSSSHTATWHQVPCYECHLGYDAGASPTVDKSLHVNGAKNVVFENKTGGLTTWTNGWPSTGCFSTGGCHSVNKYGP